MKKRRASRRGFTIVELLVTMTVIGLLTQIAIPRYGEMKLRATAASILGDVHAIRIAAFSHYTDSGDFPPNAGAGRVPPLLRDNLPTGFSFRKPDYSYDWHVWTEVSGRGRNRTRERFVGITVSAADTKLIAQLVRSAGAGYIPIISAGSVTFLISSTG
jgi:prepilin-type N-terminal cleavage/methylation domain-containing protein